MYRRISEVFDFKPPTHLERAEIWRLVTAHDAIPCEETIDWEAISLQYELTGGFIKNTVVSALLSAVGRNAQNPLITQADIIEGCKKQMRGALQMLEFEERLVPKAGLDDLIVSETVLEKLQAMVKIEKARGVLFGPWGFPDDMRTRQGTTTLFWGPAGTGRSRAAEAVGFELGKPLKVVDFPQLRRVRAAATARMRSCEMCSKKRGSWMQFLCWMATRCTRERVAVAAVAAGQRRRLCSIWWCVR
jgi:SpoVK/Ycf46/Vps4 family AAA+-type ATPase